MPASLDWLDDDILRLIGRCLADTPTDVGALASTSRPVRDALAALLKELKTLHTICARAAGITSVAQLRAVKTLMFHSQTFTHTEIAGLSLLFCTSCSPNLRELCFYGGGMTDTGLAALLGALIEGSGKYCHVGSASHLTMLALTGRPFTARAATLLAESIPRFNQLRRLELDGKVAPLEHFEPLFEQCRKIYDKKHMERRAAGASETLVVTHARTHGARSAKVFGPNPASR